MHYTFSCMSICIDIHIYTHIYRHTYMHTLACRHTCIHLHAGIHAYMNTCMHEYLARRTHVTPPTPFRPIGRPLPADWSASACERFRPSRPIGRQALVSVVAPSADRSIRPWPFCPSPRAVPLRALRHRWHVHA